MENTIKRWNMKRLIKDLEQSHGNGTSLITVMIPYGRGQMTRMTRLLTDELGTSSCIKSKSNRLSVQSAIVSIQNKLGLYTTKMPENGLVIFCGTIDNNGKERKMNIDFEPPEPLMHSLYFCGSRFNVEPLKSMLDQEDTFGFIVMDGRGCLFGIVKGNSRKILHRFNVDLPSKHGRGGQSAARFARLREEKRRNYLRKVAETSEQVFMSRTTDKTPTIKGLILAGSAQFKTVLHLSPLFNKQLRSLVIEEVDVSYGGVAGFNEAIDLSKDAIGNVRFVHEREILSNFFEFLLVEQKKTCLGVKECLHLIDSGAIELLVVWEDLDTQRYRLRNHRTDEDRTIFLSAGETLDRRNLIDPESGVELELLEQGNLLDWLTLHYKEFGIQLELVSDSSPEGHQLARGLGGMGAILRYPVEVNTLDQDDSNDIDDFDFDDY